LLRSPAPPRPHLTTPASNGPRRDHQNNFHNARLEWIIIWLIAVELVVGLFQLMGLFGIIGAE
jgi:hypothetical protein